MVSIAPHPVGLTLRGPPSPRKVGRSRRERRRKRRKRVAQEKPDRRPWSRPFAPHSPVPPEAEHLIRCSAPRLGRQGKGAVMARGDREMAPRKHGSGVGNDHEERLQEGGAK